MLLQQVQSMQHRSKDAYQDGKKVPLTSHVSIDADEEVEDYQLERTTVIEPLIERSCFPNGIEVETDSVGRRDNCTRDDVVAIHERTSNWFTDAVNVHRRSSDESDDETDSSSEQRRDHQDAKPTDIQTIVGRGNPIAEIIPRGLTLLLN